MRKPCCDKEGTNKGAWSKQEDQKLVDYIRAHGEGCWRSLPEAAARILGSNYIRSQNLYMNSTRMWLSGLHRCGKSCRLRWINYLRPDIKRGNFAQDEEDLIIKLHALLGNRWSLIAGRLPGRTDNEVKNYWNSHIRRKLIKKGIDPNNHKLHQSFPIPHIQQEVSATSAQSSGSLNKDHRDPNIKSSNDHRNSDNCLVEEQEPMVSAACHLNLDLTIAFPSPKPAHVEDKLSKPNSLCSNTRNIGEEDSSPTLLLFQ